MFCRRKFRKTFAYLEITLLSKFEDFTLKKLLVTSIVLSSLFAGQAFANCAKPSAPALPDASTAVTPEMVKAKHQVTSYMKEAEAYLACLDKGNVTDHNAMVDSMEKIAAEFNALIKEFKARIKA
jgi:hypothetical protein